MHQNLFNETNVQQNVINETTCVKMSLVKRTYTKTSNKITDTKMSLIK